MHFCLLNCVHFTEKAIYSNFETQLGSLVWYSNLHKLWIKIINYCLSYSTTLNLVKSSNKYIAPGVKQQAVQNVDLFVSCLFLSQSSLTFSMYSKKQNNLLHRWRNWSALSFKTKLARLNYSATSPDSQLPRPHSLQNWSCWRKSLICSIEPDIVLHILGHGPRKNWLATSWQGRKEGIRSPFEWVFFPVGLKPLTLPKFGWKIEIRSPATHLTWRTTMKVKLKVLW